MAKYVISCTFRHERFGTVKVRTLKTATRITARWKSSDLLQFTIPPRVTPEDFREALETMEPNILKKRPLKTFFTPGWRYSTPEMDFTVSPGSKEDIFEGRINRAEQKTILYYPSNFNPEGDARFNEWVNKTLKRYAELHAGKILLPAALELAENMGVKPRSIDISYGMRVLGRCNSHKEILLSRNLVFYPVELRRLVIAHEFAHLTHLNHSGAFHALLNRYVGGQLAELNKRLNKHALPFLK